MSWNLGPEFGRRLSEVRCLHPMESEVDAALDAAFAGDEDDLEER